MNLVRANLARSDGRLFAEFGGNRLAIDESAVSDRPALRAYAGRGVILGIRPEDMEDAQLASGAPEDRRMKTTADLREDMGSEVLIHFTVQTPIGLTEDTKELAAEVGQDVSELELSAGANRSTFIAKFDANTNAREGDRLEVFVDTRRLHFFDPDTGDSIWGEPSRVGLPAPPWAGAGS